MNEDLRLLDGGLGNEREIASYEISPTWIVDKAWEDVKEVCLRALSAYMDYCQQKGISHSFLLGLDVLITAELDPNDASRIVDIRPTIMEGPCCNSYPACPNIDAYRLYRRAVIAGKEPDMVQYPIHPTEILQTMVNTFIQIFHSQGGEGLPRIGIFTRPYPESEEETAHRIVHSALLMNHIKAYRITPEEKPEVKDGKIWVSGVPMDLCYRRIERIHVPQFYGEKLAEQIIHQTPHTIWVNPWIVDDLRSKTLEEKVFRLWEEKTGEKISRGKTLLGEEITPENVLELAKRGGYVIKKWNSTGGKGVFLYINHPHSKKAFEFLYSRYDGRHMVILNQKRLEEELKQFTDYREDASIQQLRLIDARRLDSKRLVYDTRINVLYQPVEMKWLFLSGISRVVKCGKRVKNGNSLLTNITSGAEIAPLIMGYLKNKKFKSKINYGPLLNALMKGESSLKIR